MPRPPTLLSSLSVVLCIASAALWMRARTVWDVVGREIADARGTSLQTSTWWARTDPGRLTIGHALDEYPPDSQFAQPESPDYIRTHSYHFVEQGPPWNTLPPPTDSNAYKFAGIEFARLPQDSSSK